MNFFIFLLLIKSVFSTDPAKVEAEQVLIGLKDLILEEIVNIILQLFNIARA